jgi:hypothetical protein
MRCQSVETDNSRSRVSSPLLAPIGRPGGSPRRSESPRITAGRHSTRCSPIIRSPDATSSGRSFQDRRSEGRPAGVVAAGRWASVRQIRCEGKTGRCAPCSNGFSDRRQGTRLGLHRGDARHRARCACLDIVEGLCDQHHNGRQDNRTVKRQSRCVGAGIIRRRACLARCDIGAGAGISRLDSL